MRIRDRIIFLAIISYIFQNNQDRPAKQKINVFKN